MLINLSPAWETWKIDAPNDNRLMNKPTAPILPPLEAPSWTQDEAIAFEAARECMTDWMAILTGQIHAESYKANPDQTLVDSLRAEFSRLHAERADLHVNDSANVARVRAEYGALVRGWRANRAMAAGVDVHQIPDEQLFVEPTDEQRMVMARIGARSGAVGDDAEGRLVRVRSDGTFEVLAD